MAFDDARRGGALPTRAGGTSRRTAAGGGGGGAFDAVGSTAARPAPTLGTNGYQTSETDAVIEGIERDLKKLAAVVATTRRQVDQLGTRQDSADLRKRIDANVVKGRDLSKAATSALLADRVHTGDSSAHKLALAKLSKNAKELVASFSDVSNAAVTGMRKFANLPAAAATNGAGAGAEGDARDRRRGGNEREPDDEDRRIIAQLQQVDLTESLITEREQAIDEITSSMVEVNEAMKDLAQLVDEQGKQIDAVEVNITEAQAQTESGVGHLTKATEYQKKYRGWILIFVAILLCGAGGITAYFVITSKK